MDFMEWVVTVEAAGPGADEELAEHLVNTLPAAAASATNGTTTVTFSMHASSAGAAISLGMGSWRKVTAGVDLDVVHVEASTPGYVEAASS